MLLAVDVGNTQTHLGAFDGASLVEHWRAATEAEATTDELATRLAALLALRGIGFDSTMGAIVSSVVAQLTPGYAEMSERYLDSRCLIVGAGVRTGMPIRLENPRELGADPLANALPPYARLRR